MAEKRDMSVGAVRAELEVSAEEQQCNKDEEDGASMSSVHDHPRDLWPWSPLSRLAMSVTVVTCTL